MGIELSALNDQVMRRLVGILRVKRGSQCEETAPDNIVSVSTINGEICFEWVEHKARNVEIVDYHS